MRIEIIQPTQERNFFLYVQLLVGIGLLTLIKILYFEHPYYKNFFSSDGFHFLNTFYIILVIIWCLDALRKFIFVRNLPVTTSSLLFVFFYNLIKQLTSAIRGKSKFRLEIDKNTKSALLGMVVKVFFFPIMVMTVIGNTGSFISDITSLQNGYLQINFDSVYYFLINLIFLIDTLIFGFAYVFEAKWLGNKIKSVEPTMLGWVVALSTYPPFNGITGTYIPLDKIGSTFLAGNDITLRIIQILILLCHLGFVAASISLGTKATNLTNRGIVSRGTYSIVRHPAYTVKLTAWFLEGFLYAANLWYFAAWAAWAVIYSLRAWTEERHLSQDPDYIEYKKKVKYRCIPGVF